LPHEEAAGERMKCIQEALMKSIREDGGIVTKLTYDVSPTFEQFDELYQKDGRFDSRDMDVLSKILTGKGADGSTISAEKMAVVKAAFKEADQDGDGVVTEGEFNAFAMDKEHVAHKEEDLPDMPDLLAQTGTDHQQSKFRSPNSQDKKAPKAQEKQKKVKLMYFQHLVHLGLQIYDEARSRPDPVTVLATEMYKGTQ